jgi:hypothetical protein
MNPSMRTRHRRARRRAQLGRSAVLVALALCGVPTAPGSALSAQARAAAPDAGIRGTVEGSFQGGTRPLAFATVRVTAGGSTWSATADSLGRYRVEALPPGRITLRASHAGHAPVELVVSLPRGETVDVDLELIATPIPIAPIDVRGSRETLSVPDPGNRSAEPPARPMSEVEIQALDVAPGVGHEGLLDAVRALPGNDPADASDILYMRGSTTDLKLVLLDGVPVYTPFHVAGLMRTFEPSVLGSAELHVGGAPARHDGGLTHILELKTRTARRDRLRMSGAVDFMTASAAIELPLGSRAGLIASSRTLHDLGSAPLGGERPYGYRDALIAFDAEPAEGHRIGLTAFTNSEAVLLDYALAPDDARWSNRAAAASYARDFGGATMVTRVGASGYDATLPLQGTATPGGPPPTTLLATGATERLRVVTELAWGSPDEPMRAGLSHERMAAAFKAVSTGDERTSENRGRAERTGAFFEGTLGVGPGVTFRAGLRADYFPGFGVRGAPRAALLWGVGPDALVTIAAGRYHQPTRGVDPAVEHTLVDVSGEGLQTDEVLPVATADHVVLSLKQRMGRSVSMGLDGFFKRFDGLHGTGRETVRSSGVDLRILTAGEDASAWIGYGLSWFWSGTDFSGRTADFTGRHLLTAGLSGRLAGPISGEARMSYGAGLPYTSVPLPNSVREDMAPGLEGGDDTARLTAGSGWEPPLVSGLDEEFLRVDLELQARFDQVWGGHPWTLRPYVRILNALDRRDAMFYTFQPWRDEALTPLATRSLIPLLGVAFTF